MRIRPVLRRTGFRRTVLRRTSLRSAPAAGTVAASTAVVAVTAIVALAAGCGTDTNLAADPSAHSNAGARQFDPFPEPKTWNGTSGPSYTAILGPLSGGGTKHTFTVTGRPSLVFWLGCLGTGGSARLTSPDMTLDWSVQCGVNREPAGINVSPTHAPVGKTVTVDLTIPAGARWELRIDAPVTPAS